MKRTLVEKDQPNEKPTKACEKLINAESLTTAQKRVREIMLPNDTPYHALAVRMGQIVYNLQIKTGKIQRWGAIREVTGYKPSNLPNDIAFWEEQIHSDDRRNVRRLFNKTRKEGIQFACRYRFRTQDGIYRYVEDNAIPLRDEKGHITALFGVVRDISEEKLFEEELQKYRDRLEELVVERTAKLEESTKIYRDLVDNAVVGLSRTTLNGKYIFVNDAMRKIMEFDTLDELLRSNVAERYKNPKDRKTVMNTLIETGKISNYEVELITKTEKTKNILFNATLEGDIVSGMIQDITDLKEAQERIRLQAQIIDQTHDAVITTDMDGYLTSLNKGAERLLGHTAEKVTGKHITFIFPNEKSEYIRDRIITPVKRKGTHELEIKLPVKGSEVSYARFSLSLLSDNRGAPIGISGYAIDITERKRAERMALESEGQYRTLMEHAPFPILVSSIEDSSLLYVNQQASELFKVPVENAIGRLSSLHYGNPPDYDLLVKRLRKDGFVKDYEISLKDAQGQSFWTLVSASVITFNNKEAVFMSFNDLTERKLAVEALKRREEQFRTLVERSSEVIFLSDENRKRVYVSPTIQNVLGYTVEEFLSVKPEDFTHPDHRATTIANREWTFKHPGETITFVSRVRHKDGSWRWIETSLRNLMMDPNVHAIVTNFHDITDRKEAEKQLEMESLRLEEVNTALKVLLEQRERDRNELEDKVVSNVKDLVLPYIDILKQRSLDSQQKAYLDVLETNLKNIISPFMQIMTSVYADFTPTEVKVANLIRDGKTVKEIANIFGLSETSVNTHRQHVRNKLGLKNQKNNLRTFLMSLK
jgi:PAS domain S-box-containing protein